MTTAVDKRPVGRPKVAVKAAHCGFTLPLALDTLAREAAEQAGITYSTLIKLALTQYLANLEN